MSRTAADRAQALREVGFTIGLVLKFGLFFYLCYVAEHFIDKWW